MTQGRVSTGERRTVRSSPWHAARLRNIYAGLGLLLVALQADTAWLASGEGNRPLVVLALASLVVTLLIGSLLFTSLPRRAFHLSVVTASFAWLFAAVLLFRQGAVPHEAVMVGYLIATLFTFTWVPTRAAGLLSLMGYLLLWLPDTDVNLTSTDRSGLLLTGYAATLIWFLGSHGRTVYAERVKREALEVWASVDPLTGTLNRRAGSARLNGAVAASAGRPEGLAVVMIDLDHFKAINDGFGHQYGDAVLVAVAECLTGALNDGEFVIRWGGEEFVVALLNRSRAQVTAWASDMTRAVRTLRIDHLPAVTVSAGLALLSEGEDILEVLALADRRLYAAKAAGRDRVALPDR